MSFWGSWHKFGQQFHGCKCKISVIRSGPIPWTSWSAIYCKPLEQSDPNEGFKVLWCSLRSPSTLHPAQTAQRATLCWDYSGVQSRCNSYNSSIQLCSSAFKCSNKLLFPKPWWFVISRFLQRTHFFPSFNICREAEWLYVRQGDREWSLRLQQGYV